MLVGLHAQYMFSWNRWHDLICFVLITSYSLSVQGLFTLVNVLKSVVVGITLK